MYLLINVFFVVHAIVCRSIRMKRMYVFPIWFMARAILILNLEDTLQNQSVGRIRAQQVLTGLLVVPTQSSVFTM